MRPHPVSEARCEALRPTAHSGQARRGVGALRPVSDHQGGKRYSPACLRSRGYSGTTTTSHWARATVCRVTPPRNSSPVKERPCLPITIRSEPHSAAFAAMCVFALPHSTENVVRAPGAATLSRRLSIFDNACFRHSVRYCSIAWSGASDWLQITHVGLRVSVKNQQICARSELPRKPERGD